MDLSKLFVLTLDEPMDFSVVQALIKPLYDAEVAGLATIKRSFADAKGRRSWSWMVLPKQKLPNATAMIDA